MSHSNRNRLEFYVSARAYAPPPTSLQSGIGANEKTGLGAGPVEMRFEAMPLKRVAIFQIRSLRF